MAVGEDTVRELVGDLYEAALDPLLWPEVLTRLADATGSIGAILAVVKPDDPANSYFALGRLDAELSAAYRERHQPHDVWTRSNLRMAPGAVVRMIETVPVDALQRDPIFEEILKPQEILHAISSKVAPESGLQAGLALLRSERMGPGADSHLELVRALNPHVARAARVMSALQRLAWRERLASAAADSALAAVAVDERARVVWATAAGERVLAAQDGLRAGPLGVAAARGEDHARLRAALEPAQRQAGASLRVARPSGRQPYKVTVAPLSRERSLLPGEPNAVAMLLIEEPAPPPAPSAAAERFGLTPAETRAAQAIAEGRGVRAAAEQLGVSVNTVRTHLARVFAKTGVNSQAALVRLLSSPLP